MPALVHKKDVPLAKQIQDMVMPEKIRLALTGGKEARNLLARDQNKLVLIYLLQNPRITEHEIVLFAKEKSIHKEILVHISKRKDWMKRYPIRVAMIHNPKTPMHIALKFLRSIRDYDLRKISRSKDVSVYLAAGARKILMSRGLL